MYKDPVCNMMIDENKTQYISQVGGRVSLRKIPPDMAINISK